MTGIPALDLVDNAVAGRVRLVWRDGRVDVHAARSLRLRCPCAHCIDEKSGVPRLDPATVPAVIQASGQRRVGNYAIQFTWSDGHQTGLYSLALLRSITPTLADLPPGR